MCAFVCTHTSTSVYVPVCAGVCVGVVCVNVGATTHMLKSEDNLVSQFSPSALSYFCTRPVQQKPLPTEPSGWPKADKILTYVLGLVTEA